MGLNVAMLATAKDIASLKFFKSYKGRNVLPGQRVEVYRNLGFRKQVVYSIRDAASGLVLGHATHLLLSNCEFVVSQAGRERVLREQKKNVHAWITGSFGILHAGDDAIFSDGVEVKYNPYTNSEFEMADCGEPVWTAGVVYISNHGVIASGGLQSTFERR